MSEQPDLVFDGKRISSTDLIKRDSATKKHDRLTVVVKIYHEHIGERPTHVDYRYSQLLSQDEEPYTRRVVVEGTIKLDTGYIKNPEMVIVKNMSKDQKLVVRLGHSEAPGLVVQPNSSMHFHPESGSDMFLHAPVGSVACRLHVFNK